MQFQGASLPRSRRGRGGAGAVDPPAARPPGRAHSAIWHPRPTPSRVPRSARWAPRPRRRYTARARPECDAIASNPRRPDPADPTRPARFLVTGGAGFIGAHLCDRLLAGGHAVRALDDLSTGRRADLDPRVALHEADIGDRARLARAMDGVDGVFHLAAIASVARGNEDWPGTHRVNCAATVGLLDLARRAATGGGPVPVVFASSAAVYGDAGDNPAHESLPPRPRTAYGADKLACELHAHVAAAIHGVPTFGLRFFNVYGPRQDPASPYSGVLSIFADRIAAGRGVVLHGGGAQTRDFVHVADVVDHLAAAMDHLRRAPAPVAAIANVCTGRATSVRALAEAIAAHAGRPLRAEGGPARPGDIAHSRGDPARATRLLGLAATRPIERGLPALLDWIAAR